MTTQTQTDLIAELAKLTKSQRAAARRMISGSVNGLTVELIGSDASVTCVRNITATTRLRDYFFVTARGKVSDRTTTFIDDNFFGDRA